MGAFTLDVVIVGGCGHAGLPLGVALAQAGLTVALQDLDFAAVQLINEKKMPFREPAVAEALPSVVGHNLFATSDSDVVGRAENIVVVIATPVDRHLNPDAQVVLECVQRLSEHFVDDQLLVLRSTVYPGSTALIDKMLERAGLHIDVAFCPERIAEGRAMRELHELPQIVGGRNSQAAQRAEKLFSNLTQEVVHLSSEEAELAKLFTNTWRYIKFATANQLFMIANDFGLDFERIRSALMFDYPRAADMPGPGFAAGPCLLKDTMHLAAFNNNNFVLGQASMMINEGLPLYIVSKLEQRYDLSTMTVGILGMAFKAESDDIRSSLSYKLKRILRLKARRVLCTDPYVGMDSELVSLEETLGTADLLIVGAPHRVYADIETEVPVVDIWNLLGKGITV